MGKKRVKKPVKKRTPKRRCAMCTCVHCDEGWVLMPAIPAEKFKSLTLCADCAMDVARRAMCLADVIPVRRDHLQLVERALRALKVDHMERNAIDKIRESGEIEPGRLGQTMHVVESWTDAYAR